MLCKDASEELGDLPAPLKLYQKSVLSPLFQLSLHLPFEKVVSRVSGIVHVHAISLWLIDFFLMELLLLKPKGCLMLQYGQCFGEGD